MILSPTLHLYKLCLINRDGVSSRFYAEIRRTFKLEIWPKILEFWEIILCVD